MQTITMPCLHTSHSSDHLEQPCTQLGPPVILSWARRNICIPTADLHSICFQATYAPCLLHSEPEMRYLCRLCFEERAAFLSSENTHSPFLGCCSRAQQSCVRFGACLVRTAANADSLSSWETPLWYTSGCSPASVRMPATLFAAATSPAKNQGAALAPAQRPAFQHSILRQRTYSQRPKILPQCHDDAALLGLVCLS